MRADIVGFAASVIASCLLYSDLTAAEEPLPRYGIFVYSNLCWSKQSGDAQGFRLTLMRYGDGDHVLFDWSTGPLIQAAGKDVVFDAKTSKLSFTVYVSGAKPDSVDAEAYAGNVSSDAFTFIPYKDGRSYRVPRLYDLSRKIDICR